MHLHGGTTSYYDDRELEWVIWSEDNEYLFLTTEGLEVELGGKQGINNGVGVLDAICQSAYRNPNMKNIDIRNIKLTDFGMSDSELESYYNIQAGTYEHLYDVPNVYWEQDRFSIRIYGN